MSDPALPSDPPSDTDLHTDLGGHRWNTPDPDRWPQAVWRALVDAHLRDCHLDGRRGTPISDTYQPDPPEAQKRGRDCPDPGSS